MAHILGIGIVTLDIINDVQGYPAEDSEVRAVAQHIGTGGNTANSLFVLRQLGHACDFAGMLADEADGRRIIDALCARGIDIAHCRIEPQGKTPTSYILRNIRNGSRSIVHFRDLPEYPFEAFLNIPLTAYDWLHVEGRNVRETQRMLHRARTNAPGLPCSVEIEKPREGIEALFGLADVLLFSRAYAEAYGHASAASLLNHVRKTAPAAEVVCAWGEAGAYALDPEGELLHAPAYPPTVPVDTLGAGDTFNAAYIHARLNGRPIAQALDEACRLAGRKCGQSGLDDLVDNQQHAGNRV